PLCSFRLLPFSFSRYLDHRQLHSFPTRRSSDLLHIVELPKINNVHVTGIRKGKIKELIKDNELNRGNKITNNLLTNTTNYIKAKDRKSTRLNSSHVSISYAVFCLKKKKKPQ